MSDLRQRLLDVFETEYREHSEAIRRLVSSDGAPEDGAPAFDGGEATRRAHTLKGAARAVGLENVETLVHELETMFVTMQREARAFDSGSRKAVFEALDRIDDMVAGSGEESHQATDAAGSAVAFAAPAVGPGKEAEAAATMDEPTAVSAGIGAAKASQPHHAAPVRHHQSNSSDLVRVNAQDLDRLLKSAGELHADMLFQNLGAQEVRVLSGRVNALERLWLETVKELDHDERPRDMARAYGATGVEKVSDAIKALSRDLRITAQRQSHGAKALRHHLGVLEQHVMAARMVPAESVFGSFRKMVRDVAAAEGKSVELTVEGLECEADRLILQRIRDPIMHILRNAVSHGIEPPAQRQAAGKPAQGSITLRLSVESGRLSFVVEDDGRGIDFARIARKAVEHGRITRQEADKADHATLSRIMFEPGFSTSDSVTTISGRGVGLSIVQETVADLQGTIEVGLAEPCGTRLELTLPVSILARRLLLVALKEQIFALPCEAVSRVMNISIKDIATIEGRPVARLKDVTVPLTSIAELLDLGDMVVSAGETTVPVVVLGKGSAHIGVAVDSFVSVNEFVVRHFENGSAKRRRWMGLITTEDGVPSLVLNTEALLSGDFARVSSPTMFVHEDKNADRQKTILVVDDSITTRTLEKSILEAHGYRVRLSVDGKDALAQLRAEPPDIVVSDVEMPRMNGFELLTEMKEDAKLSNIPLILVTSRSDAVDRERGLKLGADAYVVKQKFDQNELLDTIRQII